MFAKQYPVKKSNEVLLSEEDQFNLFLSNENYIEKLKELNEEFTTKDRIENKINEINEVNQKNETKKKDDQDSILSFINTIIFNIYDSLNKTLIYSKDEKNDALRDAFNFMVGVMDENTHLGNFDLPVDPQLAIILNASYDGYVPKSNLIPLNELWKGSNLRNINAGHVAAIIFYHKLFQQAIVDSLDLNARKYYNSQILEKSFLERDNGNLYVGKSAN